MCPIDYQETLVKCTVQVSTSGWETGELETFVTDFLKQNLLELNQNLLCKKFPYMSNASSSAHNNDLSLSQQNRLFMSNNAAGDFDEINHQHVNTDVNPKDHIHRASSTNSSPISREKDHTSSFFPGKRVTFNHSFNYSFFLSFIVIYIFIVCC